MIKHLRVLWNAPIEDRDCVKFRIRRSNIIDTYHDANCGGEVETGQHVFTMEMEMAGPVSNRESTGEVLGNYNLFVRLRSIRRRSLTTHIIHRTAALAAGRTSAPPASFSSFFPREFAEKTISTLSLGIEKTGNGICTPRHRVSPGRGKPLKTSHTNAMSLSCPTIPNG